MNMKYLAIIILLTTWFNSAWACGERPVMSTHKKDGTQIGLFISKEQIKNAPKWTPSNGEPPLSITSAYKIIKKWSKDRYKRYDRVVIKEISIKKHGCSVVKDRWYYVFDINPVIDDNELWGGGNWAAVLMNGTVIGTRKY